MLTTTKIQEMVVSRQRSPEEAAKLIVERRFTARAALRSQRPWYTKSVAVIATAVVAFVVSLFGGRRA